jgi:hypothetical protein
MRAISLWQPYASAIALGLKRIETRHWSTNYRGPIAIHAAKRWTREQREFCATEHSLGRLPNRLPFGAIVAVAVLEDCVPTWHCKQSVGAVEKIYGDFTDGRYGWQLSHVRALQEPVPFRGAQGFFSVPDELLQVGQP